MADCLRFDPQKRPTCAQALQHPYFQVGVGISVPLKPLTIEKPIKQQQRLGSPPLEKKKKKQNNFSADASFPSLVKKDSQSKLLKQARYVPGVRNKGKFKHICIHHIRCTYIIKE